MSHNLPQNPSLGGASSGTRPCSSSRAHPPALANFCPREEWCNFSARAIATVCRSCLSMARSRRSLLRFAEPEEPRAVSTKAIRWVLKHHGNTKKETRA